jgi:DNA-binding NarL/FixJ family response regulator
MLDKDTSMPDSEVCAKERPAIARPRILVADDHRSWLDRVSSLLKLDFDLVGLINDGQSLVDESRRLEPDLIVLDITMPIRSGIQAAHEIHETKPGIKLVFLTIHEEPEYVRACIAEGGLGYVKKSRLGTDLIPAIREALLGRPARSFPSWLLCSVYV